MTPSLESVALRLCAAVVKVEDDTVTIAWHPLSAHAFWTDLAKVAVNVAREAEMAGYAAGYRAGLKAGGRP